MRLAGLQCPMASAGRNPTLQGWAILQTWPFQSMDQWPVQWLFKWPPTMGWRGHELNHHWCVLCFFRLAPKKKSLAGFSVSGSLVLGWGGVGGQFWRLFQTGCSYIIYFPTTKPCDSHGERCQVARDDVFMSLFSYEKWCDWFWGVFRFFEVIESWVL